MKSFVVAVKSTKEGTGRSRLAKGSHLKKSGLPMDFFRKGPDPPPLFSEVMEPVRHI